jgi:uncharacterized membrane protein YidH (DUF202 family)
MKEQTFKMNLLFMLLAAAFVGLISNRDISGMSSHELVGAILAYIVILTGVSLLISRIIKWFSKDKKWDSGATRTAWTIQIVLSVLLLFGTFTANQ